MYNHTARRANLEMTFVLVMFFTDKNSEKDQIYYRSATQYYLGTMDVASNSSKQHKNDNDDQDGADDTNTTVSVTVPVPAKSATEATKQKNDQDDNQNESK